MGIGVPRVSVPPMSIVVIDCGDEVGIADDNYQLPRSPKIWMT